MNVNKQNERRVPSETVTTANSDPTASTSWVSPAWSSFNLSLHPLAPILSRSITLVTAQSKYGAQVSNWLRSLKPRWLSVEALPIDIWFEIISYLSLSELLSVRQTCKRLADISTERTVWMPHYRDLCNNVLTPPGLGQTRLYATGMDLETVTVNRIKAEQKWRSPSGLLRQTRSIRGGLLCTCSVVGGRWFLVSTLKGVKLYDFEKPAEVPRILFDISEEFSLDEVNYMFTDIDHAQSRLTFNLCMSFSIKDGDRGIVVYRVTDVGHGQEINLVANKMHSTSMPVPGRYGFPNFMIEQFGGRFYTRHSQPNDPQTNEPLNTNNCRLEIYDWALSTSQTRTMHIVPVISLLSQTAAYSYRLLPNDHLAVFWPDVIKLYDLSVPMRTISSSEFIPIDQALSPYWVSEQLQKSLFTRFSVSEPGLHLPSSTARIAYATPSGIYGLAVPYVGHGTPKHVKLSDIVLTQDVVLGVDKYVCELDQNRVERGSFTWPEYEQELPKNRNTYGASSGISQKVRDAICCGVDVYGTVLIIRPGSRYSLLQSSS